ncbi:MAG TPA: hypothetical protein VFP97_06035 [Chitinophagaceae bacterium]|nr:hypothetical protein [Chitinophagaceae bacterium]
MQHKKLLLSLALLSWIIIAGCKPLPITIAQHQIEAIFAPGRTAQLFWDSTSHPVNVGKTGGPNVYDFSTLPFVMYDSSEIVSVSQIPQLASRYTSHAVAAKEEGGTMYPVFSFSNNKFYREGRGRIFSDTTERYQHFIPAAEWLRFPVRYNNRFSATNIVVVDTTYVNGIPTQTSSDTSSHSEHVDGYGTLLLPGGLAFECLRIRGVASYPKTSKMFQFWTREGAVIMVESDNSQPDTGLIKREYVIYFSPQPRNQNTPD